MIIVSIGQEKKRKPYTAIHGSQNLSTYPIMLSRIQTSACYLFPARREDRQQESSIITIHTYLELELWGDKIPEASVAQSNKQMHTSMWSRKRRARNLVSFLKNGEPAKREQGS
jgi:hypothetical protein